MSSYIRLIVNIWENMVKSMNSNKEVMDILSKNMKSLSLQKDYVDLKNYLLPNTVIIVGGKTDLGKNRRHPE